MTKRETLNITREPLPPPFPVGTRLRCVKKHDAYVSRVDRPRQLKDCPEDWVRVSGRGVEVTIDEVRPGRRGTGRQLRDEDGPMTHDDDGSPMLDETSDGYSVYHIVRGTDQAAKMSGRCIFPDNVNDWQVLPSPLHVRSDDFIVEYSGYSQYGLVLTSGPKTFDVVWMGGSTTRYQHGVHNIRIIGSMEIDAHTRNHLLGEAETARRERAAGARVRRGTVSPNRPRSK